MMPSSKAPTCPHREAAPPLLTEQGKRTGLLPELTAGHWGRGGRPARPHRTAGAGTAKRPLQEPAQLGHLAQACCVTPRLACRWPTGHIWPCLLFTKSIKGCSVSHILATGPNFANTGSSERSTGAFVSHSASGHCTTGRVYRLGSAAVTQCS